MKSIAYAFPTSTTAELLGFADTGCWFVSEGATSAPHDAIGFTEPDHPDLIALYHETDMPACRMFLRHGDDRALAAIK